MPINFSDNTLNKISNTLFILLAFFICLHYWELKGIPVIQAWFSNDYNEIVSIRRSITADHSSFWNYMMSFSLKGIIPFYLLYLYITKKKKLFLIFLVLGSLYSISFIQKSFVITIFTPLIIYSALNKKWLATIGSVFIVFFSLWFLVTATNPILKDHIEPITDYPITDHSNFVSKKPIDEGEKSIIISNTLIRRVFYVPGMIVSEWFRIVPKEKPFLNGNGYRFLTPFTGGAFTDYRLILYPYIYPNYYYRGYKGSVNTASFVYDYANFGKAGLIAAGILLALIFNSLEFLFGNNTKMKLSINSFSLVMLSSGSLFTILFSGSWGLMVLLYLIYRNQFETNQLIDQ